MGKMQLFLTSNGLGFSNKVDLSKAACTEKKKNNPAWAIWQKYKEAKTESYLINGGIKNFCISYCINIFAWKYSAFFSIASFQQNI